jgi:hypothetical protein
LNYGQVRDASLKLFNQYSLAGKDIADTYNNQADYLRRIPELVDDAMWEIASGPRRIRAAKQLVEERGREEGPFLRYSLPNDLMDIIPGGLFTYKNGQRCEFPWDQMHYQTGYDRLDEKRILIPRDLARGELWLEYYRKPRRVMDSVNEGLTLEDEVLTVPAGATSVIIAGHTEHEEPRLRLLNDGEYENVTLTTTQAQTLSGETGKVKQLNAFLKKDYMTGVATVTAGDTIRMTGWAKPGDAVYAFMNGNTVVSFAEAPTEPDDDLELDNEPETHTPVPYYVAAHLVQGEDSFWYASLYNEWRTKLEFLGQAPQPHRHTVSDVYGLARTYDWGEW